MIIIMIIVLTRGRPRHAGSRARGLRKTQKKTSKVRQVVVPDCMFVFTRHPCKYMMSNET